MLVVRIDNDDLIMLIIVIIALIIKIITTRVEITVIVKI